jgi:hemerythrin-like domain-containing protein
MVIWPEAINLGRKQKGRTKMAMKSEQSRRQFLLAGTAAGTGLVVTGFAGVAAAADNPAQPKNAVEAAEDIAPPEDLMREHGVLNRILLIYEECLQRIGGQKNLDPAPLSGSAKIISTFIEDYHEKLEEDQLFPRFEKAGKLVDLVKVLREQHLAGRRLTGDIIQLATPAALKDATGAKKLSASITQFIRMYRPHEAREDTVLFPAIRSLMTAKEFDELGDRFEDKEHQLFGEHGFEDIVARVAEFEKTLGIYDLSQFTPKA